MKAMNDLALVGLIKAAKKELKSRGKVLSAGEYCLDEVVTLHLQGTIKKQEEEEFTPTVYVPPKVLMALAFFKLGIMREHVRGIIEESMSLALSEEYATDSTMAEYISDFDGFYGMVEELLASLPKAVRDGRTYAKVEATLVA
jgi:hypothetical protein